LLPKQNKKPPKNDITPNPHPRRQKVSREDIITRFCNVASYTKWNFFLKQKERESFEKCARHTAVDADALWQCRLTKPILGKFSYYFTFLY